MSKSLKRYAVLSIERKALALIDNMTADVKAKIDVVNEEMDEISFPHWTNLENYKKVRLSFND